MIRLLGELVLGATLAAGWYSLAAGAPPPRELTPAERKELVAKWEDQISSGVKHLRNGNLAKAELLFRDGLETCRRLYPKQDHSDLATSLNNLAFVLQSRRKLVEAEPLFREALEMHRRLFPKQDHSSLALSLDNLAYLLKDRNKLAEAEPLFREALAMRRRLYPQQEHPDLARNLDELASVLKARGQYPEAETLYREALEMQRRLYTRKDHPDLATSLNNLATLLQNRKKLVEAENLHREALAMRRRLYPKQDHLELASSLNNLASVLRDRGRHGEAESLHREALAIHRRHFPNQDSSDLALSLSGLARALKDQAKYAEAKPLYREALAMRRRLNPNQDHPDLALSLDSLASVLQNLGQYADAEPLYREALAMHRRLYPNQDHPHVAASLNNLARGLKDRGQYADAEALFREALEMNRRLYSQRDDRELARSLNNLASVLRDRGQLADAETIFREALAMYRRLFPQQDHASLAVCIFNLAGSLKDQGKYADAEPLYREALDMIRRLHPRQDHPDVALSLNNLASVLGARGRHAETEQLYREALAMRRRLYPNQDHPQVASSLNNLASVLRDRGQFAEAEPLFREALEMHRRLYSNQDHPDLALSLSNLARLLRARGHYADAVPLFRAALEMRRRLYSSQDHPYLAESLNNLAVGLQGLGQYSEADPLYRKALGMYRALASAYAAARSEGDALTLIATYPHARDGFLSNARAMQADPAAVYPEVWTSKAALTRIYEGRAMAARAAMANPGAAEILARLTDRRRRRADLLLAPKPVDVATLQKRDQDLAAYSKEIETLDREVRPLLPAVARAEKLAKATPADLQQVLPADAVVVDFLRYFSGVQDPKNPGDAGEKWTACYLAFVLSKDKVAWIDLGPAEPIAKAIAAWRQAITSGQDIPPALPAQVRQLVWVKVRQEIPDGVRTVYVCPDLALCRVAWAALPGDRPGTVLLEDYAVAMLPHAVFLLDKLWPQQAFTSRPAEALVIGGVAYDADSVGSVPPALAHGGLLLKPAQKLDWLSLPGAAAEANGVAGAARKRKLATRTLAGEKASVSAVLAALPQARLAHLATHGFFADPSFRSAFQVDPKLFEMTQRGERIGAGALSPLVMTGLVFAGANRPNTPGRGVVTGEALIDLDLSGLELAVLSACETGLGDMAGGEGTFGLQRAFHLAGTRDVVASLWKVPDRTTAALMALFYRNLWDKDMPPIEALRQAQLEIYRHPDKVAELAAGFRGKFQEVPGTAEVTVPHGPAGKANPRLWAAFTLSGPGR